MPTYDYSCPSCGKEFEAIHSIKDNTPVVCVCGNPARKMVSACGIIVRQNRRDSIIRDAACRATDAKCDLKENYGVENVNPVNGLSREQVYRDIKARGSEVRDQMQRQKEVDAAKQKAKTKDWRKKANKRAPERRRIMKEKKEQEAAAKRAIRL